MIETDFLSLIFIGCFLFGLIYLVVTALLGNLGHSHTGGGAHHIALPHVGGHAHTGAGHIGGHAAHGPAHATTHGAGAKAAHGTTQNAQGHGFSLSSYINPTSIILFLLGFGFFGYVFHNTTNLALPLALLLAALSGAVIAALLLLMLARAFGNSEGATVQDVTDRTGLLGKVSITIQENGFGEIIYQSPGGMRKSIAARSVDGRRLERDQEVVVVNYQRGVAEVDTWDHFVSEDEQTFSGSSAADELAKLRALIEDTDNTDSELVMRKDVQKE